MITIPVELGDRRYEVLVGPGAIEALPELVPSRAGRVAVVTQAKIQACLQASLQGDVDPGVEHRVFLVGEGEEHKTLASVEALTRAWSQWGLTRADAVVAIGGGLVTDLAGFAAAVYHRGIDVVHVPTTLLGQVDAAVGGKTGVNLPEGKNLVGAYWQPRGVICDTDLLATLPPRELRSGQGEVAKYHFLDDGAFGTTPIEQLDLDAQVARCVAIKAAVVGSDERESDRRAILNYGHTLGHALEVAGQFDLRHGEAVAVGLVFAAELARTLGRIDDERVVEHRRVVAAYDLPSSLPRGVDRDELVALFGRDKKAIDGVTFVLDGPRGLEPVSGVDRAAIDSALDAIEPGASPGGSGEP